MSKGSGTRSGLLWEVERILQELVDDGIDLPQVLLMENVPQVHGKKNIDDFESWCKFLESIGYTNFWEDMNAKNYGVAQNRNRTFMVSVLGDVKYEFPNAIPLTMVMKDYLEDDVDEKFYINNEKAQKLIATLIENGTLPSRAEQSRAEQTCVDLTINNPRRVEQANCIKARYDAGISNFQADGTSVVERTRERIRKIY